MKLRSKRYRNPTRLALSVALLGMSALGIGGCHGIDPNGCSSTDIFVAFPKAVAPNTTVQLTIDGHVYEMVCPRDGAYLPVTGGGIGGCDTHRLTLYLSDNPPSEIVNVSLHAQDANGMTVFEVSPVTFSPNVTLADQDGMPGVCYLTQ